MNTPEQELQRMRGQVADIHKRMRAIILATDWEAEAAARERQLAALDAYDYELEEQAQD